MFPFNEQQPPLKRAAHHAPLIHTPWTFTLHSACCWWLSVSFHTVGPSSTAAPHTGPCLLIPAYLHCLLIAVGRCAAAVATVAADCLWLTGPSHQDPSSTCCVSKCEVFVCVFLRRGHPGGPGGSATLSALHGVHPGA